MTLLICPNCGTKLNPTKIKKHFQKVHTELSVAEVQNLIPASQPSNSTLLRQEISRIAGKFSLFEQRINGLRKNDYFETVEFAFIRLIRDIEEYSDLTDEELNLDENILFPLIEHKFLKRRELIEKLNKFKLQTPGKQQFIKDNCQTIYVTWSDLTFDKNKIRISANKAFVKAIEMPERRINCKNLKIEDFRRYCPNARFKLVIYKGVIRDDLSSGTAQILEYVEMFSPSVHGKRKAS
jgi:hypothetical protein